MDRYETPSTLHCAPLGWPAIRSAMARVTRWFDDADPALMICDVSVEIAQMSRLCSVPYVKILQHGDRGDPGHLAAYDGAVGLLAPFHAGLSQTDWTDGMLRKTCFAGGLGISAGRVAPESARRNIGVGDDEEVILVVSGGGGSGFSQAPLGVGARSRPKTRWISIGEIERDWHATEPANLDHRGWVNNPEDYIAAADIVVSSTGNTTCQQILAASKPWLAVPEWRYFDEQHRKAAALEAAGAATVRSHLPSSTAAWTLALSDAVAAHNADAQRALIDQAPARRVAEWLEALAETLWPSAETHTDRPGA